MLLTINSKLKKTSKLHSIKVVSFNLPPIKTCPQAGICKSGCYACQGRYAFKSIQAKLQANLIASQSVTFKQDIQEELNKLKPSHVRLHSSGDFYSQEYLNTWVTIAKCNSSIIFYAYTKSIELLKNYSDLPSNFKVIYSIGGLQDYLVDKNTDRHSQVFPNQDALVKAGYTDGSSDDMVCLGSNPKIGLVYHGVKALRNTKFKQE
jgi:hypothetical protein